MNNQNESPFGNPRFVVSIIAVFLLLWGWQYYVNKTYPPIKKTAPVAPATAAANDGATSAISSAPALIQAAAEPAVMPTEEKTFSYEDDRVKWQISSHGMGLNSLELKTYFDKDKKPVIFQSADKLFALRIENQPVYFELNKISEIEFVGSALIGGKNIKRTVIYNREKMHFETTTEFDTTPQSLSFSTGDIRHKISSSFLLPSFEKQDFLYKDAEKVKVKMISSLAENESLSASAQGVSLASVGTQYFVQAYLDKSDILPSLNMNVTGQNITMTANYDLTNSKVKQIKNVIFIGAKLTETLNAIDPLLPEVMDYGIFGFISKPLLSLMKFLHNIFGNWGVAIIALTLVMRLLMLPFNIVSFKSARAMQKIQPQLAAIREKYKNDPMQVNRETMALMKQHNANPLSSCLPMLIQIPIFFALWKTIGSSIEIYQQPFFGWITDLSAYDHFFVLPILMGITMYYQQKLTPTTMDPMQAKILNFMPLLFSLFMLSLPSGLTLYNFISSLFGVAQQYFLLKDTKKA